MTIDTAYIPRVVCVGLGTFICIVIWEGGVRIMKHEHILHCIADAVAIKNVTSYCVPVVNHAR